MGGALSEASDRQLGHHLQSPSWVAKADETMIVAVAALRSSDHTK
jgi:hypothetical protein